MHADVFLDRWATALRNRNPGMITGMYASNAVLLPTLDARPLVGHKAIYTYFDQLMQTDGLGVEYNRVLPVCGPPLVEGAVGIIAGLYTFRLPEPTPARFTFVYRRGGSILHHHSSAAP